MKRIYAIPITLVSVTAAAIGITLSPSGSVNTPAPVEVGQVTENTTLGYDFEYLLTVPNVGVNDSLVITLPERARVEPVILYSDDFGDRAFFENPDVNGREIRYHDLKAGDYHFVYTSESKDDTLSSVLVIK